MTSCGKKSPRDSVEKSRSIPEKYRQEDGLHLQQHVFCEKRFYFWLPNSKVWGDSPDSNDPRPHADLRISIVQSQVSGQSQFV
ncbi:hypothetical protein TNCV_3121591 [Trichonephila clavipes]|nr:hypothetical protein TNCV_3121591 [Trichonephila clavipes]